ncbi:hypothetical protein GCM10010250_05730 [Streptomyces althioticus]|nr:hypothetical protein GCM10010250_05730 [Streptomyces althioticus]
MRGVDEDAPQGRGELREGGPGAKPPKWAGESPSPLQRAAAPAHLDVRRPAPRLRGLRPRTPVRAVPRAPEGALPRAPEGAVPRAREREAPAPLSGRRTAAGCEDLPVSPPLTYR